jgi:hypothetical protein
LISCVVNGHFKFLNVGGILGKTMIDIIEHLLRYFLGSSEVVRFPKGMAAGLSTACPLISTLYNNFLMRRRGWGGFPIPNWLSMYSRGAKLTI